MWLAGSWIINGKNVNHAERMWSVYERWITMGFFLIPVVKLKGRRFDVAVDNIYNDTWHCVFSSVSFKS